MKKELIVMLTWHDVTVKNAMEVFQAAKDAPTKHWGFKIEGTTPESMRELAACMKENGKKIYIEILAIDESRCLKAAKQCIECKVDHVLGTVYFESVAKLLSDAGIAYSPFVGPTDDLHGTIDFIINRVQAMEKKNIYGLNLTPFRYTEGDPEELLRRMTSIVTKPYIIAGSVDCYEKLDIVKALPDLYGFTIGGGLFRKEIRQYFYRTDYKGCRLSRKVNSF